MSNDTFQYWTFLAGISFFLIGMRNIESALKTLAGRNFKLLLRNFSSIPLFGILVGIFTTAILQSSSVIILMVIALVGANVLPLSNAVNIILGANLGTTFTGWIVTFLGFSIDMEKYIFPLIAGGGLTYVFVTRFTRLLHLGQFILGLGLMLFGLTTMKTSIHNIGELIDLNQLAQMGLPTFVVFGFLIAGLIQSSSATMVITLSALHSSLITLPMAAALIIGADLGTTMTGIIGTIGGSAVKKRVALAHFLFNLASNSVAVLTLPLLIAAIQYILPDTTQLIQLVAFHSLTNVLGILLFFPILKPFTSFLEKRFQNQKNHSLLVRMDTSLPEAALQTLHTSVKRFIKATSELYLSSLHVDEERPYFMRPKEFLAKILGDEQRFNKNYQFLKEQEGEILDFALDIQKGTLNEHQGLQLIQLIHSLREAGLAAKALKDIEHNIREMESSTETSVYNEYQSIKRSLIEFLETVEKIHEASIPSELESLLLRAEDKSMSFNTQLTQKIHNYIKEDQISQNMISSLLNANRELFSSRQHLLLAYKNLKESASDNA